MKRSLIYMACFLFVAIIHSCKDNQNIEAGLALTLSILQQDATDDITLWTFDEQGVLRQQFSYVSPKEVAATLIQIP